jgi:cytoskeletal protein RodZ
MKPVGTILRKERKRLGISLKEASSKTKIPLATLKNLEENQFENLPREPYCSLFVKDYAQFLSLPSAKMVAICRRDLSQLDKPAFSAPSPGLNFTPRLTVFVLILVSLLVFAAYLFNQYRQFQQPPFLKVNWPPTDSVVQKELEIKGVTDPQNIIRVNQKPIIVDSQGNFSTTLTLEVGANTIQVEATSLNKKTTTQEKIIGLTLTP